MKKIFWLVTAMIAVQCDARLHPSLIKNFAESFQSEEARDLFFVGARNLYEGKVRSYEHSENESIRKLYGLLFENPAPVGFRKFVTSCPSVLSCLIDYSFGHVFCGKTGSIKSYKVGIDSVVSMVGSQNNEVLRRSIAEILQNVEDSVMQEGKETLALLMSFACDVFYTPLEVVEFFCALDERIISGIAWSLGDTFYENRYQSDRIPKGMLEEFFLTSEVRELISLPYYGAPVDYDEAHYVSETGVVSEDSFPDCVENATRNLVNILLIDKDGAGKYFFNLEKILDRVLPSKRDCFFRFFTEIQPIETVWNIDENVRAAWNAVVSNINDDGRGPKVEYLRTFSGVSKGNSDKIGVDLPEYCNELNVGFRNHMKLLCRLFSLDYLDMNSPSDIEQMYKNVLGQISGKTVKAHLIEHKLHVVNASYSDYGGILSIDFFHDDGSLFAHFILSFFEDLGHAEVIDASLVQ
ncbi:MAG: hypothetical protein LBQ43_02010 [Holosporales bacterium]|nr:hypothetical protein [Holosporales bacterium]